jgi:hypothetical protein
MTTIYARQLHFTKMHIRKTTPVEHSSLVYIYGRFGEKLVLQLVAEKGILKLKQQITPKR